MGIFCTKLHSSEIESIRALDEKKYKSLTDEKIIWSILWEASSKGKSVEDILQDQQLVKSIMEQAVEYVKNHTQRIDKIGTTKFSIANNGSSTTVYNNSRGITKQTVAKNPKTLYIHQDSVQQRAEIKGVKETVIEGIIKIKDSERARALGAESQTSEIVRTDANGEHAKNAFGITTRKNRAGSNSENFEAKDIDRAKEIIHQDISEIKEALDSGEFDSVVFPQYLTGALNRELANYILDELKEQLGILAVANNTFKSNIESENRYNIEILGVEDSYTIDGKKSTSSRTKNATSDKLNAALESSKKERPNNRVAEKQTEDNAFDTLSRVFPNIHERKAKIDFITTLISDFITRRIEEELEVLRNYLEEELDEYYADTALTRKEVLDGLTRGDYSKIRLFALQNLKINIPDENGNPTEEFEPLFDSIINDIYNTIYSIANASEEDVIDLLLNQEEDYLGKQFLQEARQKNWRGNVLRAQAGMRAKHLIDVFEKMSREQVWLSLLEEARYDIEVNEGIVLSNIGIASRSQDENTKELDEDNLQNIGKMDFIMKYRFRDPWSTLSIKMKSILNSFYRVSKNRKGETILDYNDMGMPVKINSSYVYYVLLQELSGSTSIEDFDRKLDKMLEKYPWMENLVNKVKPDRNSSDFDFDLRKELYRAANKIYVQYGYINSRGFYTSCNYTNSASVLFDNINKNYEGGLQLTPRSIYTEYSMPEPNNIDQLISSLTPRIKGRDREELKSRQPLAYALITIQDYINSTKQKNLKALQDALNILNGTTVYKRDSKGDQIKEDKEKITNSYTFEEVLKALGIDTNNIDLNAFIPQMDIEGDEFDYRIDTATSNVEFSKKGENDFKILVSKEQLQKIYSILTIAVEIAKQFGSTGNPLIHDNKARYTAIAGILSMVSEGYTQNMFRFQDKSRPSYTVPSRIDIMTNTISNGSEKEALDFIFKEWGNIDFYYDRENERYKLPLLESMTNLSEELPGLAETIRRNFKYTQILAMGGRDKANEIQQVDEQSLLENTINAYASANSDTTGTSTINFGWFRNPLFSDVDALCFFKLRRYTGGRELQDDGTITEKSDYKKRIVGYMVDFLKQEIDRIKAVRRGTPSEEVEFFNDKGKLSRGAFFQFFPEFNSIIDEILKSTTITAEAGDDGPTKQKESIDADLEDLVSKFMQEQLSLFMPKVNDTFKVKLMERLHKQENTNKEEDDQDDEDTDIKDVLEEDDEDLSKEETKRREQQKLIEEANEFLEEFFYNDFLAQIQLIQLLGGDLAQYKSFQDFIKRNKQVFSGGERVYYQDEDGNELYESCIYIEDSELPSSTYSLFSEFIDDQELTDTEKAMLKGAFMQITTTDGQSLRTLDSFKVLYEQMGGKWSQDMESLYNRLKNKTATKEDFRTFFNTIKPFVFTYEEIETNGRIEKVYTQHKNSEYLLTAAFSFFKDALSNNPILAGLQEFMQDNGIDVAHFHSVVKEGYNSGIDLSHNPIYFQKAQKQKTENGKQVYYIEVDGNEVSANSYKEFFKNLISLLQSGKINSETFNDTIQSLSFKSADEVKEHIKSQMVLNPNGSFSQVHRFPLRDYMIMQPTDDHLVDSEALVGSQLRNIVPADLPEDFSITLTIGKEEVTLNKEQAVAYYNALITSQTIESFDSLLDKFDNLKSIESMIQAAVKDQPSKYGIDLRRALTLDESGTQFRLPFNTPLLRGKVEDLLLSQFKNHIQRQHIKGGNAVLVSNFGLHNQLHVQYKTVTDANGKQVKTVDYIPCYLSYTMKDQLQDFLTLSTQNGITAYHLDFEKMKKILGKKADDILEAIGYRIPTEDKYSMFPLRIVGFMPAIGGSTIMLPSDIITMSGTDFDIDKLFLMLKALRREVYDSKRLLEGYTEFVNLEGFTQEQREATDKMLIAIFGNEGKEVLEEYSKDSQKVISRLSHAKPGMTQEEIDSLCYSNLDFNRFMKERGEKYKLSKVRYVVKTSRKINWKDKINYSDLLKIDKEERDNLLIDFIFNILTSPEGSRLMMRQGHFTGPKKAARVQRILSDSNALRMFINIHCGKNINKVYEQMEKMSWKELDTFYEQHASIQNPMNIITWTKSHRNLMDGNDLIGILAVNSSSHYKLQFLNLKLNTSIIPKINGIPIERLDPIVSPITGERVGETCAQAQAASPDNGKDPCLGDMNLNPNTADLAGILMRVGLSNEMVGLILNSMNIYSRGKQLLTEDNRFALKEEHKTYSLNMKELMLNRIQMQLEGKCDESFAVMFYRWLSTFQGVANDMSTLSPLLRCDSANGALSTDLAEAIQQIIKFKEIQQVVTDPEFSVKGLENFIDFTLLPQNFRDNNGFNEAEFLKECMKSPIPRLQAFYSLGFGGALEALKHRLPELSDASINRLMLLQKELIGTNLLTKKNRAIIKKFLSEFVMYQLSGTSLLGDEDDTTLIDKRNYYLHDFPIKLKIDLESKQEKTVEINGKQQTRRDFKYPNIRNLEAIRRLSNRGNKGIKMDNMGQIKPEIRKWYTESFNQLLNFTEDSANGVEEVEKGKQLAFDLAMYSYYDNGMTFRHNSFSNFFSSIFLNAIPGLVEGYREAEKAMGRENVIFDYRFIKQFLLNNPSLIYRMRRSEIRMSKDFQEFEVKPVKGTTDYPSKIITVEDKGTVHFKPFLKIVIEGAPVIFELVDDNKPVYRRVKGTIEKGTLVYNRNRDINSEDEDTGLMLSELQERGNTGFSISRFEKLASRKRKAKNSNSSDDISAAGAEDSNSIDSISTSAASDTSDASEDALKNINISVVNDENMDLPDNPNYKEATKDSTFIPYIITSNGSKVLLDDIDARAANDSNVDDIDSKTASDSIEDAINKMAAETQDKNGLCK